MTQAIQITRAGKMTETIRFRNPQGLEKFVEAFAGTETPPTENQILSFIKENPDVVIEIVYKNKNGQRHDGANGDAAVRRWDQNRKFIYAGRYSKGMLVREYFTPEGLAAYEAEMKTKKALAVKLPPGMKFV